MRTAPAASSWPCWKTCAHGRWRQWSFDSVPGTRPAHRRSTRRHRKGAVCIRPALPVPRSVDGPFAVRRIHRRTRPQHANQRRLREHAQGVSLAEDWIRAGRCRRVIVISADDVTSDHNARVVRRGLSGQRSGSHRRRGGRRRHSVRPPPPRHDYRHGRRGPGGRERGCRPRTRASSRSAKC